MRYADRHPERELYQLHGNGRVQRIRLPAEHLPGRCRSGHRSAHRGVGVHADAQYTYDCLTKKYIGLTLGTVALQFNSVGTVQIQMTAIETAHIQDAAITAAKIADVAIGTAKIQDAAVVRAKITEGSIGVAQIEDASITNTKTVALTANKITAGTLPVKRFIIRGLGDCSMPLTHGSSGFGGG